MIFKNALIFIIAGIVAADLVTTPNDIPVGRGLLNIIYQHYFIFQNSIRNISNVKYHI
jgi:hypothetical protein